MIKTLAVQLEIISLSVTTHAAEEGYEEDLRQLDARLAPDYLVPGTKFEEEDGHDQYLEEKRLFEEWLDSNPLVITKDGFVMPVKEAEAALEAAK